MARVGFQMNFRTTDQRDRGTAIASRYVCAILTYGGDRINNFSSKNVNFVITGKN